MNIISLGLGRTAALVLTLGFASGATQTVGNYVTLGYAESAAKVVTLGLGTGVVAPPGGGSYITLGQGESASRFAMLGLTPAAVVVPPPDTGFGGTVGFPIIVPRNIRLLDDDEVFLWVIAAAASSGLLKG